MPELPETETLARDLDEAVRGATITAVDVRKADVLRECNRRSLRAALVDKQIARVWRRAKLVVIDIGDAHLVVQPRFTGGMIIDDGTLPPAELAYVAVTMQLGDGRLLHYRDVRRLGTVTLMSSERFAEYTSALGAEPLASSFDSGELSALVRGCRQAIKVFLMDQRKLAGVGNIYANEALWHAGIDPSRAAHTLSTDEAELLLHSLRTILAASIEARGTSFRDYRDARGNRGSFVEQLAVYGRQGLPCHRCGRKVVATHAVDGRSSFFCSNCQR